MNVKHVFIWLSDGQTNSKATLEVPGLGEVEISHALSSDIVNRITAEATTALKVKLGQTIEEVTGEKK